MLKKVLAIVVSCGMVLSMAACGGSQTPASSPTAAPPSTATADANRATTDATAEQSKPEVDVSQVTEYTFLKCWNGAAAQLPEGVADSLIMTELANKTGVKLNIETIVSSESEKLAMLFSSGDIPDITDAPHWGTTGVGGSGEMIRDAAIEGLILPLSDKIDKYPNLKRLYSIGAISELYWNRDINNSQYNGEIYVIPTQTGRTQEDTRNWAYNLFARSDILEALGIAPESVTTSDAIYDLLKQIKDGGFVDTNGRPVIPGGTWHNGWNYGDFLRGFGVGGYTGWDMVDGKLVTGVFNQAEIDKTLFMRKLVSEGLMDPECFTQTDTMANEKMITGRIAVFGCHYPNQYDFLKSTLYVTNPEMKFVPLGPILNLKGEVPSGNERVGRTGSPVLFLSSSIKDPDKALNFIDYINSDEGLLLMLFGIEGTTYNMIEGKPTLTPEWKEIQATDTNKWNGAGFGVGDAFIGANPSISRGWNVSYEEEGYVKAREVNPLRFYDYDTIDNVVDRWPGKPAYEEKMATTDYGNELKKAFLAKSDEEAIAIIQAQRNRMIAAGYEEMEAYVNEQYAADPKLLP